MAIYSVWASGPITNSYTWFGNNNTNLVPGATDWVYINYVQSPNNPPYTLTGNGTFGYLTVTSTVTFTNSQITVVGQDGPNEGNGYNSTDYDAVVVEGSLTFSGAGTSLTADEETWVSSVNTTSPASLLITNSATAQFQSALNANGQWTVALDLENGSATISGQGTSATTDNGLIVGDSGFFVTAGSASNSALTVSQGAAFEVGSSHGDTTSIGNALNTTGTITVTDANTTMTSDAGMEVGVLGTGTLDVVNTATLTLGASDNIGFYIGYGATGTGYFNLNTGAQVNGEAFADIGNDAGSYGDATIDGMNTTWTQTQDIAVGYGGFGILTVQNQATVTANALIAGVELGSWGDITLTSGGTITVQELRIGIADHGDITVDGTGSTTSEPTTLTVSDDATVGEEGDGYLTVQDGGQATITNDLTVGVETSGIGYVTVTGQDATGTNASTLGGMADFSIGDAGDAYVYVSAGGAIDAQTASVEIGVEDDSTGQLLVTDDDSSVDTADMTIGVAGDGTVLAENAGALTNTSVTLGEQEGGSGTVTLTDQETSWDISGDLTIGAAGDGTFSDSGADLSVDGDVILGAEDTGTGSLTLNAATPNFGSDMIIGEAGTGQVYVNQGSAMTVKSLTLGSQAELNRRARHYRQHGAKRRSDRWRQRPGHHRCHRKLHVDDRERCHCWQLDRHRPLHRTGRHREPVASQRQSYYRRGRARRSRHRQRKPSRRARPGRARRPSGRDRNRQRERHQQRAAIDLPRLRAGPRRRQCRRRHHEYSCRRHGRANAAAAERLSPSRVWRDRNRRPKRGPG